MPCFLFHVWRAVGVYHYNDTSFGNRCPSTVATLVCKKCGRLKEKTLWGAGFLTVEQLNAQEPRA